MHKWNGLKQKICPPCRHYQPSQETCALLANSTHATNWTELLNGQGCDPERFLRAYLTRYITAKYGVEFLNVVEEAVKDLLASLRATDAPATSLDPAVTDFRGFREWLMSYARDWIVARMAHTFAQPVCGLCDHYRRPSPSVCRLQNTPNGNGELRPHPWFSHPLPPDQDPLALVPPCHQFSSDSYEAFRRVTADPARPPSVGRVTRNPFDAVRPDDLEPMLSSFLERLARRSLRTAYIVRKVFLYGTSPEDVARELGMHGWAVRRELDHSLELLQQFLTQCKLDNPGYRPG